MPVFAARVASRYLSHIAQLADDLYVVIGNYGRGNQVLYPSTRDPKTYSRSEADRLVGELQDRHSRITRPDGQVHWHAKLLSEADKYVERHEAVQGLNRLRGRLGVGDESDDW